MREGDPAQLGLEEQPQPTRPVTYLWQQMRPPGVVLEGVGEGVGEARDVLE
ncbi:MAG: hypothetical protein AABM42_00200 [Actinomycetota bacterium]